MNRTQNGFLGTTIRLILSMALIFPILSISSCIPGRKKKVPITLSYTYNMKKGENEEAAKRRAKIEAQRELIRRTHDFFPNHNGEVRNMAIYPITIDDLQVNNVDQTVNVELHTEMSLYEFDQRNAYIDNTPGISSELSQMQNDFDEDFEQLENATQNLEEAYEISSDDEWLQDFLETYLELILVLEEIFNRIEQIQIVILQLDFSEDISEDIADQEPEQIFVYVINGNWEMNLQFADLFESSESDDEEEEWIMDSKSKVLSHIESDNPNKQDLLDAFHLFLMGLYFDNPDNTPLIYVEDLIVSYPDPEKAELRLKDSAIERLSELYLSPDKISHKTIELYPELGDANDYSSFKRQVEMVKRSMRLEKYFYKQNGRWKLWLPS